MNTMNISSASSFDFNTNEATAGCLSGLLRLLLCKNFHQSALTNTTTKQELASTIDIQIDYHHLKQEQEEVPRKSPPSPNLVARLMGLDSMPIHPYTPEASFIRSRSTNSIQGWNGFLSEQNNWATRNRTSHSFREEPTFLRKENDDFFILSFDYDEKENEEVLKPKLAIGKEKESKDEKNVRKRDERRINKGKENIRNKASSNKQRLSSSATATKKIEPECSSQDSSPVSILDQHFDIEIQTLTDQDSPISEENKKAKQEKAIIKRRMSSGLKSDSYPSTKNKEPKDRVNRGRKRSERKKEECISETWRQICQLAAEDVKTSCWNFRETWNIEDITAAIGLEILESIVDEALVELYCCGNIIN